MAERHHAQLNAFDIQIEAPSARQRGPGPRHSAGVIAAALATLLLMGCGDYNGDGSGSAPGGSSGAAGPPIGGGGSLPEPSVAMPSFETTVYPILVTNCSQCHSGAGPGSPNFAHADPATAYNAVMNTQKVNLGNPIASRFVQRLAVDLHYCWGVCTVNAEEMRAAIATWATDINYTGGGVDPGSIRTDQLQLRQGIELDSSDERFSEGQIALWEFKDAAALDLRVDPPPTVALDTSGVEPAMDLSLQGGELTWLANYGIDIVDGTLIAEASTSKKLFDRIASPTGGSGQYSVEGWIVPANITQEGPARIFAYSQNSGRRNFTLGQVGYQYDFRNRNASVDLSDNGTPSLRTYDMDRDLQATLQHVVMTYDPYDGRRIYVDGQFTDDMDEQQAAPLWNWADDHRFGVGNEFNSSGRQWEGKVQLISIYDRALSEAQINQNYLAGVGRKVVLRFDISQWAGQGAYLEFLVSQLDTNSYLFCQPVFYSASQNGMRIAGLRIAVNGTIPVNGQAFTAVDAASFGQPAQVSRLCSVIPVGVDPDSDVFEIDLEIVDGFEHEYTTIVAPPGVDNSVLPAVPVEGVRDFSRVSAAMGSLTHVSPATPPVRAEFMSLQQQLPAGYDLRSFVSSHQVGLSKLALEYCDALVEDTSAGGARETFFGIANPFDFDADVTTAFAGNNGDLVVDPIVDQMILSGVPNQPDPADVRPFVDGLVSDLVAACPPECDAVRTRAIVKAACTAVLASGAVTIH